MRPIYLAQTSEGKTRPVVLLTRAHMAPALRNLTVAPITSTVRGLPTEVAVGRGNGLDHDSAVSLDNVQTIRRDLIGRHIGYLTADQEDQLRAALLVAYDL